MATAVRVLVHDTGASHSLLGQLAVKDQLGFIDSTPPGLPADHQGGGFRLGLCMIKMDADSVEYVPTLCPVAANAPRLTFDEWWTGQPILRDGNGVIYCRRQMMHWLANKDGGAHIDSSPTATYRSLSREGAMGWSRGTGPPAVDSPVPSCMRQISEELRLTIREQLPHLLQ